jgi:hypothetical protein
MHESPNLERPLRHWAHSRSWPRVLLETRFLLSPASAACKMAPSTVRNGNSPRLVFDASYVAVVHTVFASVAFVSALCLACLLHYKKVVRNDVAQWPDEWWPSVSAT